MRLSNGIFSLFLTIACYVLFYVAAFITGGNESNNQLVAAATFISITFVVNFPIAWGIMYKLIKNIKRK